jgi:hypothetical protein
LPGSEETNTNSELRWTVDFIHQLHAALVDAFNHQTLERSLKLGLGRRLDLISTASSFETVVLDVINAAEREEWRDDLLRAAYRTNPSNSSLSGLLQEILVYSDVDSDSFMQRDRPGSAALIDVATRYSEDEEERIAAKHGRDLNRLRKFGRDGRLLLFVGSDVDASISGIPGRQAMADTISQEEGIPIGKSWMDVTPLLSRAEVIQYLNRMLDDAAQIPQPYHKTVAKFVVENHLDMIVTTAYDDLLYAAIKGELGKAPNRIVIDAHFAATLPGRPNIVQLFGSAQQLESLILSRDDLSDLLAGRDINRQRVLDTVRQKMASSAVLFVGLDLRDITINFLLNDANLGRFTLPAFAIWPGLSDIEMQALSRNNNLTVIDSDPLPFLNLLQDA